MQVGARAEQAPASAQATGATSRPASFCRLASLPPPSSSLAGGERIRRTGAEIARTVVSFLSGARYGVRGEETNIHVSLLYLLGELLVYFLKEKSKR